MIVRAAQLALPLLVLAVLAVPVAAQRGHMFAGPTERALHTQLTLADVVAIGRVDDVAPGRFRFVDVRSVEGAVAGSIDVKRAPSRPPGLSPGERIALLLRGARAPYLLIPSGEEVVRIGDDADEERIAGALADLRGALSQPSALLDHYQSWLTGPDEKLRRLAEVALSNPTPPLPQPEPSYFVGLVALATDGSEAAQVRRAAARVAGSDAEGVAALLAALPGQDTDPKLLLDALRLGALRGSPEMSGAVVRSFRHSDVAIRRAALELGPILSRDPVMRAELERVAERDPSESLRNVAASLARTRGSERRRTAE